MSAFRICGVRRFVAHLPSFGLQFQNAGCRCGTLQFGIRSNDSYDFRSFSSKISDSDPDDKTIEINPDENALNEANSERRSNQIRFYKKLFSTLLFGSTIGLALWARRRKQLELKENFDGTVRLQPDENFTGSHREFYRVTSSRTGKPTYVLPGQMIRDGTLRKIQESFEVEPTDVYVASFPKSGTTWVQEIVYLLKNHLDFEKAKTTVLESRFPYLEYPYPGLTTVQNLQPPRLIKTHLPYDLLPKGISNAKVIYISRNPKDVVVSYYHFARMLSFSSYKGSFEEFCEKFKNNQLPYTPYYEHVNSYLEQKEDNPSLLILTYEELSKDPAEVIRKIAQFLDTPVTEEDIQVLVQHTSFTQMSKNPSTNYSHWEDLGLRNKTEGQFFRKGEVGDFKNYFSPETNVEFDHWAQKHKLNGVKLAEI